MADLQNLFLNLFPEMQEEEIVQMLHDPLWVMTIQRLAKFYASSPKMLTQQEFLTFPPIDWSTKKTSKSFKLPPGFAIARFYGNTSRVTKFAASLDKIDEAYTNIAKVYFLLDGMQDIARTAFIRKTKDELIDYVDEFEIDPRHELRIDSLSFSSRGTGDFFGIGAILGPCIECLRDAVKFIAFREQLYRQSEAETLKKEAEAAKAQEEAKRMQLENDYFDRKTKIDNHFRYQAKKILEQNVSIPEQDIDDVMDVIDAQIIETQSNFVDMLDEDVFTGGEIIDFSPPDD